MGPIKDGAISVVNSSRAGEMRFGFATKDMAAHLVGEAIEASVANSDKIDVITEDKFGDC